MKIILSGCCGKMGAAVILAAKNASLEICAGVDKNYNNQEFPFPVYTAIDACPVKADAVVDFSRPDALSGLLAYSLKTKTPAVLASTGYTANDVDSIKKASENVAIFRSANMSLGVNLLMELSRKASTILNSTFDMEILEKHHNTKVDSPSGTAKMLANAINEAAGGDMEIVYDRHNRECKRPKREIGISAIRGGTITGEHSVIFAGQDEVLELSHSAYSRRIYAEGAVKAAEFIAQQPNGFYDMTHLFARERIVTRAYCVDTDSIITLSGISDFNIFNTAFSILAENNIIIDMISQPAPINGVFTLSFSLPSTKLALAQSLLTPVVSGKISIIENISKLSVEGSGMEHQAGATSAIISMLCTLNIPVYLITTSETKISCCVSRQNALAALNALKKRFNIV